MSRRNYNNRHRRGDVYENNEYRNYNPNRNFYNRNFQQGYNPHNNDGINSRPPRLRQRTYFNNTRNTNNYGPPPHSIERRSDMNRRPYHSGSRRQQQHRYGPRHLRLNDFMPPQLRDMSPINVPSLPSDFNLANSDTTKKSTSSDIPNNVLTQRPNFATQTKRTNNNNTTQPFNENDNNQQEPQHQQTTTASYRRRQRRTRQQQYRSIRNGNDNRFTELADTDIESNYDDINDDDVAMPSMNNENHMKKKEESRKKKKQRIYLEPTRILRYMQDNAANVIGARGNQNYMLAAAPFYDEWIRSSYELQTWQAYLKMGTEDNHWSKEVVARTKKRDNLINSRFVQKKINLFTSKIAEASASISTLQVQLGTYWTQTYGIQIGAGAINSTITAVAATSSTTNTNRIRESVDRLEKVILKYIQHCTQHVKQLAEQRIKSAKAQLQEFKALEEFEKVATPVQWSIHSILKTKMKLWNTKNKNYHVAMKRVEYDLPPKFISKLNCTFKIDESILELEEAQTIYNRMRQLTKDYRTQAMSLYLQSITRERELLSNDIERIIEGMPKENDDGVDCEAGDAAFKVYHELREKRFNLEAIQSMHFLEEQQVEGDVTEQEEQIVAPTLIRSLGEDFLLQQ